MTEVFVNQSRMIRIRYRNHRGEVADRTVAPLETPTSFRFATIFPWYPEEQWLLDVYDLEKKAIRTLAMQNILSWETL